MNGSPAPTFDALTRMGVEAHREGALADAIDYFTAANRLERNASTERLLMGLRRDAAGAQPTEHALDAWPRVLADPFPGVAQLPEINGDALDAATLGGAILRHGALLVRGLVPAESAIELQRGIDLALAARDDAGSNDGWYAPLEVESDDQGLAVGRVMTERLGGGLLAVDSPRAFFLFAELVSSIGFTTAVRDYLGEAPVLSADKTTFRRLCDAPRTAWHQDGSFMGEVRVVNLWLSLSRCGAGTDTRGLDVIPRRLNDLLDTGTEHADAAGVAIGQTVVDRAFSGDGLTPYFEPGDALCFDERFVHRTSAVDADGVRHAVEAWFFAPSHFPERYTPISI